MPELTVKMATNWSKSLSPVAKSSELVTEVGEEFRAQRGADVVWWSSDIVDYESKALSVDVTVRFDVIIPADARKRYVKRMNRSETNLSESVSVYGFDERA